MSNSFLILITIAIGFIIAYCIYHKTSTTNKALNRKKQMLNKTKYGVNRIMKLHSTRQLRLQLPPRFALVTDLDHTLIGIHSDQTHQECNEYIKEFNDIWCKTYAPNNCVLIYATGRNFEKYKLAVQEWDILKPDILVSQDGVNIHWFNKSLAQHIQSKSTHKIDMTSDDEMHHEQFMWYDESWQAILEHGWDQNLAEQIHDEVNDKYNVLPLPAASKSIEPFRIGVLCKGYDVAKDVEIYIANRVNQYNEENKEKNGFIPMRIHTFSGAERSQENAYWSAATPIMAGKGSAIEFIRKRLELDEGDIVCMGDSGNDISMMELGGVKSVVVANASHELLHFYEENNKNGRMIKTDKPNVLGVIEGLQYYGPKLLNK